MSLPHWEYFLAIESDLEACARYIEFSKDNYSAYSLEFALIILASCSEIDTVLKLLCKEIDSSKNPNNITKYHPILTTMYPKFREYVIEIPRFRISDIQPWKEWNSENSPEWWQGYNNIKHERDKHFKQANLKNAINSVAGLLCVILYYYRKIHGKEEVILMSEPKILLPKWYGGMEPAGIFWTFTLPDDV